MGWRWNLVRSVVGHAGSILPALVVCATATSLYAGDLSCDGRFEGKNIKLVVPYNPGGGYDTISRVFAPHYEKATGANVLVENIAGGSGRIGAKVVRDADPDGLTIGLVNGPKRAVDKLVSDEEVVDILGDYTILGRVARTRQVYLTGAGSGIEAFEDILGDNRPVVSGTHDQRSGGFIVNSLVEDILDMRIDLVTGIKGTRKLVLSTVRGDIDLFSANYNSVFSDIESGQLIPLLQVSTESISDDQVLEGVPLFGGPDGLAVKRAMELGRDPELAMRQADSVVALLEAGRLFVAPVDLPEDLSRCIPQAVLKTLESTAFRDDMVRSNMVPDVLDGEAAKRSLESALENSDHVVRVVRAKSESLQ